MKIHGGIFFNEDGISTSIRSMHLQTVLLDNINDNMIGYNKNGFQRKVPTVTSFAEIIGAHAFSEKNDTSVGRLRETRNPLDIALGKEGYFLYSTPQGNKTTRDGRFKMDKNGYLLTLENYKVLSSSGQPVKFNKIPDDLTNIKINLDGDISLIDPTSKKVQQTIGKLAIVTDKGSPVKDIDVRQGFSEDSNVVLQNEVFGIIPVRRNFEANRQLYIIQNDALSKTIQELGRAG